LLQQPIYGDPLILIEELGGDSEPGAYRKRPEDIVAAGERAYQVEKSFNARARYKQPERIFAKRHHARQEDRSIIPVWR